MNKANNENIGHSIGAFIKKYGVPEHMNYDSAAFQVGSKTIPQKNLRKHDIKTQRSSTRRPNGNLSKGSIFEIKRKFYRIQEEKNIPDML